MASHKLNKRSKVWAHTHCHKMSCVTLQSGGHPHFASALLNLNGFLWKQNASPENVRERAKMPMRRELERETGGEREMVLWRRDNTKLVWVVCQACKRNITLTPILACRNPHGISMSAKLWQSLSNQGPVALNYWAVTSNNNSCISKAHEIMRDIKTPLVCSEELEM